MFLQVQKLIQFVSVKTRGDERPTGQRNFSLAAKVHYTTDPHTEFTSQGTLYH